MLALATLALGLVIADANILTLDPAQPKVRHAAIVDGKVAYLGNDLGAARKLAGPGARELDALGTTVLPGFNDAHVHFGLSFTIGSPTALDLGAGPESRAAFDRAILAAAARPVARDQHDWIFVTTRALPDGVSRGADLPKIARPLFVVTERGGLLNKVAQQRVALSETDTPLGFVRGRYLPAALDRIVKGMPRPILLAQARRFLAELGRLGLTSVQLMDEVPELFEELRRSGELTARVRMMVFGYRFETDLYRPSWKSSDPSMLTVDAVKYFHDDWARLPRAELAHIYEQAKAEQLPVVLHVLSRSALRSLLDQLDKLERADPGGARWFRIDHADEVTPELAARIAKLGIIVCPNPAMLPEWRNARAFPMRTLLDAGVTVGIGSDYVGRHEPARPLSPLFGVMMAVTHGGFGAEQRVTVDEALRAFTIGSAAAESRTDLGALKVGAAADLVGLAADPTTAPAEEIAAIAVRFTMVAGRVVFERKPTQTTPPSIGPATGPGAGTKPPLPTIGPAPTSNKK